MSAPRRLFSLYKSNFSFTQSDFSSRDSPGTRTPLTETVQSPSSFPIRGEPNCTFLQSHIRKKKEGSALIASFRLADFGFCLLSNHCWQASLSLRRRWRSRQLSPSPRTHFYSGHLQESKVRLPLELMPSFLSPASVQTAMKRHSKRGEWILPAVKGQVPGRIGVPQALVTHKAQLPNLQAWSLRFFIRLTARRAETVHPSEISLRAEPRLERQRKVGI